MSADDWVVSVTAVLLVAGALFVWWTLKDVPLLPLPADPKQFGIGDAVTVYDRHRFAIPLAGEIVDVSVNDDSVKVRLLESNHYRWPVGSRVIVHAAQLKRRLGK